jgi:cytochrome o ubiquinol oxidase subunit 2
MLNKRRIAFILVVIVGLVTAVVVYTHGHNVAVLNPQGPVAAQERNLIFFGLLLSLVVVVPVFAMAFGIAWKYRESNPKAKYTPNWDHNRVMEGIWWGIPSLLILILSVVAWNASHSLDPFKPLASKNPTMTIQVVAMDWKWLFIYPGQGIATVNYVQFPAQTPVDFQITSDAPMNSFWIPQLGGQIYAMPGMSTQLYLLADHAGSYRGSSANISGQGFSGMDFVAKSSSKADFESWVKSVKKAPNRLTSSNYSRLANPSENNPVTYYNGADAALYNMILMKYMAPAAQSSDMVMQ